MSMTLFGNKIILLFFALFLSNIFSDSAVSIENKILFRINNEIITNIDIKNEVNYLKALNKSIKDLSEERIKAIAKKTLIREKIRKIELLNYTNKIEIDKKNLDKLIKSKYLKLGINNKDNFIEYLKNYNLKITEIEKKILIEELWKQLIFSKFSKKVKIDKEEIKKRASIKKDLKIKSYLLAEILFKVENNNNFNNKFNEIKDSILNVGFENSALIYSTSNSSKIGGKLGWIKESSLNNDFQKNLNNLKINDITKPKVVPGGFLILKIQNIKFEKIEVDIETEIKILTTIEKNRQLNQYSNIYYNKIEKNFQVDEL
jgi:peptidyl-prolyl cis-trans isomerase SurA